MSHCLCLSVSVCVLEEPLLSCCKTHDPRAVNVSISQYSNSKVSGYTWDIRIYVSSGVIPKIFNVFARNIEPSWGIFIKLRHIIPLESNMLFVCHNVFNMADLGTFRMGTELAAWHFLMCETFEKSARFLFDFFFCVVKRSGCAQFILISRFDNNNNNLVTTEDRLVNFFVLSVFLKPPLHAPLLTHQVTLF